MGNICTRSGRLVDPWYLEPKDVCFRDVAWALSHIVRFAGHVDRAWTVADHTLFVARILRQWGLPARVQLLGLIHDAPEYVLQDLPSPVKGHLGSYKQAERRAEAAVHQAAGFPLVEKEESPIGVVTHTIWSPGTTRRAPTELELEWVKRADIVALVVEAERMLPQGAWKVDEGWDAIVRNAGEIESGHRSRVALTRWELVRPRRLTRRAWSREFERLSRAA